MNTKLLKVGDRIFIENYSRLTNLQIINRVTKTIAFSKDYKFDIEYWDNGSCIIKPYTKWSTISASISTPELEEKWKTTKINNWFTTNIDKFSDEDILKIYNLFN